MRLETPAEVRTGRFLDLVIAMLSLVINRRAIIGAELDTLGYLAGVDRHKREPDNAYRKRIVDALEAPALT